MTLRPHAEAQLDAAIDAPLIVECACTAHDCPELAEGTDLCLACRHGACPDDTE